jgi:hypothetical protein
VLAQGLSILSIALENGVFLLKLAGKHPLLGEHLVAVSEKYGKRLAFADKKSFTIKLNVTDIPQAAEKVRLLWAFLIDLTEALKFGIPNSELRAPNSELRI